MHHGNNTFYDQINRIVILIIANRKSDSKHITVKKIRMNLVHLRTTTTGFEGSDIDGATFQCRL